MDVLREACGNDEGHMRSLGRVRGSLEAIFISDLVTADGKYIEQHVIEAGRKMVQRSSYCFPKEEPNKKDWEIWMSYFKSITNENFEMPTPLGKWENPTHRKWEWILDEKNDILYRRMEHCSEFYMKINDCWVKEGVTRREPDGKAASVRIARSGRVHVRSSCDMVVEESREYHSFWEVLDEWGGDWM